MYCTIVRNNDYYYYYYCYCYHNINSNNNNTSSISRQVVSNFGDKQGGKNPRTRAKLGQYATRVARRQVQT